MTELIFSIKVKPYNEIRIRKFSSDLNEPQVVGTKIDFRSSVNGEKKFYIDI